MVAWLGIAAAWLWQGENPVWAWLGVVAVIVAAIALFSDVTRRTTPTAQG